MAQEEMRTSISQEELLTTEFLSFRRISKNHWLLVIVAEMATVLAKLDLSAMINWFDHKYRFWTKKNTAIWFSTPENLYIRSFVKNRPKFEKSIRIDPLAIVESIDSTRNMDC